MSHPRLPLVALLALSCLGSEAAIAQQTPTGSAPTTAPVPVPATIERERTNIDADWRFALGHATDPARDFGYGTVAFFFAKAGYGDGPASPKFDDRAWRRLNLPHDWGVEVPFDQRAESNHGSRSIGPGFPEHNIGWYRKTLSIPGSDRGKRIAVEFDGIFRDATLWFNGHYIGEEHSGYSSVRYDLTDYVNYDGPNVLVVRVNTSTFEGWFYEGAGIYRHVWLTKTDPLHVAPSGTFVTSEVNGDDAVVTARATIANDDTRDRRFSLSHEVIAPDGTSVASATTPLQPVGHGKDSEATVSIPLRRARLWSLEDPALYRLVTTVKDEEGRVRDRYDTKFGVRTIKWDANAGFMLNGRPVKLQGTDNHQDHAGIGVALPDELQVYRLERLKAMGSNAYRASHHPPTPELLDAADRLGMLVIDEHRMMGTSPEIRGQLDRMVVRDRNHPSVILWSVGNEEWAIEGNELGARLTTLMQARVRELDPTRPVTAATSGADTSGIATTTEVAGFNYRAQHDSDAYHKAFPNTPIVMTEEGATNTTRGIYFDDPAKVHLSAYDRQTRPTGTSSIEDGWRAVVERPWMAGMFVWTGFDYRGETTPFNWPAISTQFGMLDTTGLLKDSGWYLKTQWRPEPTAHIVGHWTWPTRVGQPIPIWVYANADEAELTLNGRSLGRRAIPAHGHAEWSVPYSPGRLVATAFKDGKRIARDVTETTGPARSLSLSLDRPAKIDGSRGQIAIVDVTARDAKGRIIPEAAQDVTFTVENGGEILGVGNGDPGSHEADRFVDSTTVAPLTGWQLADLPAGTRGDRVPETGTASWRDPFRWYAPGAGPKDTNTFMLRGRIDGGAVTPGVRKSIFLQKLDDAQRVFVNGRDLTGSLKADGSGQRLDLDEQSGGALEVSIVIPERGVATLQKLRNIGMDGRNVAFLQTVAPAGEWHRSLFSGHAQVIVRLPNDGAKPVLKAVSPSLRTATMRLVP